MSDMTFNGTQLTWSTNGGKTYKATSGLPHGQNSKYERFRNLGPVPNGTYSINLFEIKTEVYQRTDKDGNTVTDMKPAWGLQRVPHTATINGQQVDVWGPPGFAKWGPDRLRLNPVHINDPEAAKRGGFYLHDSGKGYSHGCVEVDSQFFTDLRAFMKTHHGGKLSLQIKYPSNDTVTNGGTGNGSGSYSLQDEIQFHQQNPKWDPRNDPNYDPRDE